MPYKDPEKAAAASRKNYWNNLEKRRAYNLKQYRKRHEWMNEIKSSLYCSICGENHPACLEFHHRDQDQKLFSVADAIANGKSREVILTEIAKCDVLCSNCHRKLHWQEKQDILLTE